MYILSEFFQYVKNHAAFVTHNCQRAKGIQNIAQKYNGSPPIKRPLGAMLPLGLVPSVGLWLCAILAVFFEFPSNGFTSVGFSG